MTARRSTTKKPPRPLQRAGGTIPTPQEEYEMSTTIPTAADTVETLACLAWCVHGDGFRANEHPDDRWCTTSETRVELSQHGFIEMNAGTWTRDFVAVYPMAWVDGHKPPEIHLGQNEDAGLRLTPNEARAVADALYAAASIVDPKGATR